MALLKFELKEDHIKLLKHLRWSISSDQLVSRGADKEEYGDSPFGGDDLIEDMNTILNGKPDNFDPLNDEGIEISEDEKVRMLEIYYELPIALDIILYSSSFELGHYKTKWYDRNWVKFTPKKQLI
jgi:hypothetical protein